MTFLLDANVLLDFQNARVLPELAQASHMVEMAVAEKVRDEVTLPRPDDSASLVEKKRQAEAALRSAHLETIEIFPGTPQAALLQALTPVRTTKARDQGEAGSIAVARFDARLVFVTGDKTAVLWR